MTGGGSYESKIASRINAVADCVGILVRACRSAAWERFRGADLYRPGTVPDGTRFNPGATFTKTWRLRNIGTCTWTTAYSMVFQSGEQMGGPASVPMPSSVAPGQNVDVSVNLTAPNAAGHYIGYWRFRN